MNFYLHLRFTWHSYVQGIRETVHTFHLRPAFKVASFVLIVLMLAEFPIFRAFAGDAGTVPAQASDAQYTYYVHGDHLGSAHLLTEGQSAGGKHVGIFYNKGDLIQRIEYNPYGQETYVLNPNLSFDPSFTGQTYDIESGLYYFNARYYNPQLGRFIQADTVVPSATDFQSYNRYAYARNNPLKYVDPSGHSFQSMFAAFMGALIGIMVGIATFGALLPEYATVMQVFWCAVAAGAIGGAAGGLVSGLIMGGIRGALIGMAMGAVTGAVSAGIANKFGGIGVAIMMGVGLALSIKAEGWEGIGTFAAGLLGAYCGGQAMNVNIFACFAKKAPAVGSGKQATLDLGFEPDFGDSNLTPSVQPSPNQAAAAQQPNVTIEGTTEIIRPPPFDWKYEVFDLENLLRNMLIAGGIGATFGAYGGAAAGTTLCPGLGTIGGAFVGGFVGANIGFTGFAGAWVIFQFQAGEWINEPITILAPWAHGGGLQQAIEEGK